MRKVAMTLVLGLALVAPLAAGPGPGPGPGGNNQGDAIGVVTRYLDLTEEQRNAWRTILEQTRDAIRPIAEQIRGKEHELGELLRGAAPDPTAVGTLVVAIRNLHGQIEALEIAAAVSFEAILTVAQKAELAEIREAAPYVSYCPVIPAFAALHLVPREAGPPAN